jgi:hypothetical protein
MKRILSTTLLGASLTLGLPTSLMAKEVTNMYEAREELARGVATLAADPAFDGALREHIIKGKASLADVLRDIHSPGTTDEISHLRDVERRAIELRGLTGALDAMIDVRVHGVDVTGPLPAAADFWTGTISRDPTSGAEQVVAFDPAGAEHRYPVEAMPSAPMLLVESDSSAAVRAGVGVMNAALQANSASLQRHGPVSRTLSTSSAADHPVEQLTLIKKIYLTDDEEKNSGGDAEVFAIVSGIGPDGKAQLITKDMPWLDHDKRWYTPGMDLINWTDYGSNYVNVQLFEDDGNTNFKELAAAVIAAVGDLSLLIAPEAPPALIIAGVTKIADQVLKAMPASWFTNPTDYIDSFYVIERGGNYGTDENPMIGAREHARMVLMPYEVKNR